MEEISLFHPIIGGKKLTKQPSFFSSSLTTTKSVSLLCFAMQVVHSAAMRLSPWVILGLLALPGWAIKQLVNFVQVCFLHEFFSGSLSLSVQEKYLLLYEHLEGTELKGEVQNQLITIEVQCSIRAINNQQTLTLVAESTTCKKYVPRGVC